VRDVRRVDHGTDRYRLARAGKTPAEAGTFDDPYFAADESESDNGGRLS
jgi:hypothetical protein